MDGRKYLDMEHHCGFEKDRSNLQQVKEPAGDLLIVQEEKSIVGSILQKNSCSISKNGDMDVNLQHGHCLRVKQKLGLFTGIS